jgi:DNA-binding NarL/FixJ family response regulator
MGGVLKVLVADDHYLIREGIRYALERGFPGLSLVEAAAGDEVMELATAEPDLDLILLDYFMPGADGDELVTWLVTHVPRVPVVVLSAADDPVLIHRLHSRGITRFLSKSAGPETIISVVHQAIAGRSALPAPSAHPGIDIHQSLGSTTRAMLPRLTHRQRQVLMLLLQGRTNKDISRELHVSENTIKVHVTAVLKILGVANRIQAVLAAQRLGLLPGKSQNGFVR